MLWFFYALERSDIFIEKVLELFFGDKGILFVFRPYPSGYFVKKSEKLSTAFGRGFAALHPLSFLGVGAFSDNGLLGRFAKSISRICKECRHNVMF